MAFQIPEGGAMLVERGRFAIKLAETDAELALLNQLWALVMARKNHLLPA